MNRRVDCVALRVRFLPHELPGLLPVHVGAISHLPAVLFVLLD